MSPLHVNLNIFSTLLLLILVGCATPVAQQEKTLAAKLVCCKALTEFNYQPLSAEKEITLTLDENAPAFDFGRGKTYFSAVAIGNETNNRVLIIKSLFNGSVIGQYLQPIITFLDGNYTPIAEISPALKYFDVTIRVNAHMGGAVQVPSNARYLIVSTGKLDSDPGIARTSPGINVFMLGNSPVVSRSAGRSIELTRSPTGKIELLMIVR